MQGQQPMEFVETIVEAAVTKVGSVVWRGEAASILSSLQITEDQLLNTLLMLLTAVIMSVKYYHTQNLKLHVDNQRKKWERERALQWNKTCYRKRSNTGQHLIWVEGKCHVHTDNKAEVHINIIILISIVKLKFLLWAVQPTAWWQVLLKALIFANKLLNVHVYISFKHLVTGQQLSETTSQSLSVPNKQTSKQS